MIDLALHINESVYLKDICRRQEISFKYLDQIITELKAAGLVRNARGHRGGYKLTREAENINVWEIFRVLEGGVCLVECVDDESLCKRSGSCITRTLWVSIKHALKDALDIKLSELAKKQENMLLNESQMFCI
jgi:Rrf2 family protein